MTQREQHVFNMRNHIERNHAVETDIAKAFRAALEKVEKSK